MVKLHWHKHQMLDQAIRQLLLASHNLNMDVLHNVQVLHADHFRLHANDLLHHLFQDGTKLFRAQVQLTNQLELVALLNQVPQHSHNQVLDVDRLLVLQSNHLATNHLVEFFLTKAPKLLQ